MAYAIGDYAALQAAISEESGGSSDTNFAEGIRRAIYRAETEMNTRLRVPEMMVRSRETVNERWEALPTDFLKLREAWRIDDFDDTLTDAAEQEESGTDVPLRTVSPEVIGHYSQFNGLPKAICVVGGQYRIEPRAAPGEAYLVRLWYYAKVPPLSDETINTTVLDRYPNLYLYGALGHLGSWLHGDPRLDMWRGMFDREIDLANMAAVSRTRTYTG